MKGSVYLLTNDCMPNLVKIGVTTNIKQRMRQLDTTGIPMPFTCVFAIEVEDCKITEELIHDSFKDRRVRKIENFLS